MADAPALGAGAAKAAWRFDPSLAYERPITRAGVTVADFTKRRTWPVELDGRVREITVEYASLSGFMTILVDGSRLARAWREWQTVFGGAVVTSDLDGHRIEARITQPFGVQTYSFALTVDGRLEPGSDDLPPPPAVKRSTLGAIGALALVIFIVTFVMTLLRN
jgi:hypothetical protein